MKKFQSLLIIVLITTSIILILYTSIIIRDSNRLKENINELETTAFVDFYTQLENYQFIVSRSLGDNKSYQYLDDHLSSINTTYLMFQSTTKLNDTDKNVKNIDIDYLYKQLWEDITVDYDNVTKEELNEIINKIENARTELLKFLPEN
ncbi:hypothetical protein V1503_19685 [Bacillus sp. SCS-151]|uniref:hypothetical protein n=1 Tax=Nanhaiella sioensis TaxID=3115293 RepID=UPI00397A9F9C